MHWEFTAVKVVQCLADSVLAWKKEQIEIKCCNWRLLSYHSLFVMHVGTNRNLLFVYKERIIQFFSLYGFMSGNRNKNNSALFLQWQNWLFSTFFTILHNNSSFYAKFTSFSLFFYVTYIEQIIQLRKKFDIVSFEYASGSLTEDGFLKYNLYSDVTEQFFKMSRGNARVIRANSIDEVLLIFFTVKIFCVLAASQTKF